MSIVGDTYLTLRDLYKQQDGNRDIVDIIEVLAQTDQMLEDAPAVECNQGTVHLTTVRKGLPEPVFRKLYEGVKPTKGTEAQVKEATGFMETWSEVDAQLVELAKNPQKYRLNAGRAHIQALMHKAAETIVYGDIATEPEKFTGLSPRFSSLAAANGSQIVDAGGTGNNNTSIWFVTWGENSCHLLYPEGTTGGLRREDKGKQVKQLPDGSLYDIYWEKFIWHLGLSVRDWRGVAVVRNVDVTKLGGDVNDPNYDGADLIDLMIDAYYRLDNPNQPSGRTAIYCTRAVSAALHKQAANRKNMNLMLDTYEGRPRVSFLGHPIRRLDALLATEPTFA